MEHPLLYLNYIIKAILPGYFDMPHVTYTWLIIVVFAVLGFLLSRKLQRIPRGGQNLIEAFVELLANFMDETIGHGGSKYLPLIGSLAIFILVSNLMGLVPGFMSPTSNLNTTVACALTVFLFYQRQIRHGAEVR